MHTSPPAREDQEWNVISHAKCRRTFFQLLKDIDASLTRKESSSTFGMCYDMLVANGEGVCGF